MKTTISKNAKTTITVKDIYGDNVIIPKGYRFKRFGLVGNDDWVIDPAWGQVRFGRVLEYPYQEVAIIVEKIKK